MARSRKQTAAGSRLLPLILRRLRDAGTDTERVIRTLGLPRDAERVNEVAISPTDFERLLALAAGALGDPLIAVRLPDMLDTPTYNIGELAARSSPTLRDAFERVVRYAPLFYAHLSFELKDEDGEFALLHRLRSGSPAGRFGSEFGIASTLSHARRVTGVRLVPRRVWFQHPAPPDVPALKALKAFFGTEDVAFGRPESGIAFDASDAARPLHASDPRLLRTAEELADRALAENPAVPDFVGAVSAKIREGLPAGKAEAALIARRMRLSVRTFQRRLEECGVTFSDLRGRVCRDVAEALVRDPSVPLGEVAYRSGFSDLATFGRAFKRWTGESPSAYRRAQR